MTKSQGRVCILGLDGATYTILDRWVASGEMPNLARLMEEGVRAELMSTMPPITGPAWTTMTTGMNPGGHGVFDFYRWDADGINAQLVRSRDVLLPRLWDIAGRHGKSVGIFNMPLIYPSWQVNGFMVTGMLTPGPGPNQTWPNELASELTAKGINPFGKPRKEGTPRQFARSVIARHQLNEECVFYLLEKYKPDFFFGVFLEPDRLQHHLWPYMERAESVPDRKVAGYIADYFHKLDATIGRMRQWFGDDAHFMIVSDHGFGPVKKMCRVNSYLAQAGFLSLDQNRLKRKIVRDTVMVTIKRSLERVGLLRGTRQFLNSPWAGPLKHLIRRNGEPCSIVRLVNWEKSRAVLRSRSECGVIINVKGQRKHGVVDPADYDKTVRDVTAALEKLRDPETGARVVQHIIPRDLVVEGPFMDRAPDLLVLSNGDYILDTTAHGSLFVKGRQVATHHLEGVFIAAGPNFRRMPKATLQISDVAPTALYAMGMPVPRHMEGRCRTDIFTDEFTAAHPVQMNDDAKAPFEPDDKAYSTSQQDQEMLNKLRQLGYV